MRTKTRLWAGGLADIVQRAKQQLPESAFITCEQELSVQEALISESKVADDGETSAQAPTDAPDARLLPPRPPVFGRSTLVGHAFDLGATRDGTAPLVPKRPELYATRLVPIESLLAGPEEAVAPPMPPATEPPSETPAAGQPARAPQPSPPATRRFEPTADHLRRGVMVLLALAAAVLFALPKPEPAPALPKVAQSAAPGHAAARTAPVEAVARREHVTVAGGRPADAGVSPRQAVDALASGDYARAQRLYAQLAQAEGGAVYAEAARILEERIRTRSY